MLETRESLEREIEGTGVLDGTDRRGVSPGGMGKLCQCLFLMVQTGVSPPRGGFAPSGMARKGTLELAALLSLLANNNLFPLSKDSMG